MKCADLHVHTNFSDGTMSPPEVVAEALRQNVDAVAVTDHDTVLGLDSSFEEGGRKGIEIIAGIELTAEYEGIEIHLLGYLLDHRNQALVRRLQELKQNRVERIYKIIDKLEGIGVHLAPQAVFELAQNGTVGRLHVARAMVKAKIVGSVPEAFQKYIGDTCPGYVCGFRLSPAEAIALIRSAGGVAVLAHPYTLRRDDLIPYFVELGLQGLEAYYPEHAQAVVNFYLGLAKKYKLLVTGGSDFHGSAKPDVKLGAVRLPYELVERLKERK
ncbi:MAG TPA: PHP domain-containing protein [Patescibacteria group bacterium]|nr:PHP domain-containing protein [Patescibacteria group bacterium]